MAAASPKVILAETSPLPLLTRSTMFFEKFRQPRLGYAEMRCLERLPNFFAAGKSSGIVAPGLMADEILEPRSFPCFRRFALFHKADRRIAP